MTDIVAEALIVGTELGHELCQSETSTPAAPDFLLSVSFLTNSALVNAPSVTLIHHSSHKTKQITGNKARGGGRRNQEELFDK